MPVVAAELPVVPYLLEVTVGIWHKCTRRSIWALVVSAFLAGPAGCWRTVPTDVGDSGADAAQVTGPSCWTSEVPVDGFHAMGASIQLSSSACGDGPCIVFNLEGDPRCVQGSDSCDACPSAGACVSSMPSIAEDSLARVYCGLHCETVPDSCPTGYACPGTRFTGTFVGGPYCIPTDLFLAAGGCLTDADCEAGVPCNRPLGRCRAL